MAFPKASGYSAAPASGGALRIGGAKKKPPKPPKMKGPQPLSQQLASSLLGEKY